MVDILIQLFDSLLNGKNSNKNIAITIIVLLFIGLNLLGIDLSYMTNHVYALVVLVIIIIVLIVIMTGTILIKLNSIDNRSISFNDSLKINENVKEDIDLIESQILKIIDNQIQMINSCRVLIEEVVGIPNIKFLKMLFELKINSTQYEIFRECITYTLTANECSQKIVLDTLKNNVEEIKDDFTKFIRKNLKKYNINEKLSDTLGSIIDDNIIIIVQELEKDKKLNEKLYVISAILKKMEEDIENNIIDYLKDIQINLIQN